MVMTICMHIFKIVFFQTEVQLFYDAALVSPVNHSIIHLCVFFLIAFTFFLKLSDYNHLSLISILVFPLLRSLPAQEPSGPRKEEL